MPSLQPAIIELASRPAARHLYTRWSPSDDRHLAYVAMSRHREEARLYYATDDFKDGTLIEGLSGSRPKEATTDYHVDIANFLERRGLESTRS